MQLGECAPCKARRLQEEANEDFKKRYGMYTYQPKQQMAGYRPVMGQVSTPVPSPAATPWKTLATERLTRLGINAAVGLPIGILGATITKSAEMSKKTAGRVATWTLLGGVAISLLPLGESKAVDFLVRASGFVLGVSAASLALPASGREIPAV